MTKPERARVVELLRCAADVVEAGERPECAFSTASERLGYFAWDKEPWRSAWSVEQSVADEQYADWTEDGYPYIRYAADDSTRLCERVPVEWSERGRDYSDEVCAECEQSETFARELVAVSFDDDECIFDDSTDCDCPRCSGRQAAWELLQGWGEP